MIKDNINNKDISKERVPDNLNVPTAIRNAVNKIREIGFVPDQCVIIDIYSQETTSCENVLSKIGYEDGFLSIGWFNTEEEEQIEKLRNWKNFDCIWVYNET